MKTSSILSIFALGAMIAVPAFAAKSYQVSGPVLEATDTKIVIQKGKEKWELERDKNTKVTGDLKAGSKATVYYTMTATEVEVKAGKDQGKKPKK